jgi:hypothetical protein
VDADDPGDNLIRRRAIRRQVADHRFLRRCEDALGYSYRFVSEVKNGNLTGLHGKKGEPSSLLIEGAISDDGTGRL